MKLSKRPRGETKKSARIGVGGWLKRHRRRKQALSNGEGEERRKSRRAGVLKWLMAKTSKLCGKMMQRRRRRCSTSKEMTCFGENNLFL